MDWEKYRRPDGSIDLVRAAATRKQLGFRAKNYLQHTELLQPIKSRQVAAQAIATACMFDAIYDDLTGLSMR